MNRSAILVFFCAGRLFAAESDPEWLELVTPTHQVEIGLSHVQANARTAIQSFGADLPGNSLAGGFRFSSPSDYTSESAMRWRVAGERIGMDNHEILGEWRVQGHLRLNLIQDRIISTPLAEGYQTPFRLDPTSTLVLPTTSASLPTNPVNGAVPIAQAMQPMAIEARRTRTAMSGNYWLNPAWEFSFNFQESKQSGHKVSGATSGTAGSSIALLLPEPIDTSTYQYETRLGYLAERSFLQLAYQASLFKNNISAWTFQSPFAIPNTLSLNRMGSPPDNQAHYISLSGGTTFGKTTRLTLNLMYGRMTQNQDFIPFSTSPTAPEPPRQSLDGLVVTKRIHLKLATRPLRALRVNTTLKYDDRDNRTAVDSFELPGVNLAKNGEVGTTTSLVNTPISRRRHVLGAEGIYSLAPGSELTLALQQEELHRYCRKEQDCVEVGRSRERSSRVEWRYDILADLTGRIGYGMADRSGDSYQKYAESVELAGMRKFFLADRAREQWRGQINLNLARTTTLGLNLENNQDRYNHSPFGLQSATSRARHADITHQFNDDFGISLFGGREQFRSLLSSSYDSGSAVGNYANAVPNADWQARMTETVETAGIAIRHKGLENGRWEIEADLSMVRAKSPYQISGGSKSSSAGEPAPLPKVSSRGIEARINVRQTLDEQSALRWYYLHRRLASADFALDLYTNATLTRLLGTNEYAPRFAAHLFGVSYIHAFK